MLTEYRQRFADYNWVVSEDGYLQQRGARRYRERLAIFRDHRDLFSRGRIEELRRGESEAEGRGAQSYRRMLIFALDGHLASAGHEIEVEIERLVRDPQLGADPAPIDDLLAARADQMDRAAKDLGYADRFRMRVELDGIDYGSLAGVARRLLDQTERAAHRLMEKVPGRELRLRPGVVGRDDLARWARLPEGAKHLRYELRAARQAGLCAGLGFRTDQQRGIEFFEAVASVDGRGEPGEWPDEQLVWPQRIPDLIRTGLLPVDGRYGERAFWQSVAATQMAAWTSTALPVEYQYRAGIADAALPLGWGMLFDHLLLDAYWVGGCFGYAETGSFREGMAALRLLELRQAAAQLVYEGEYLRGELGGRAAERYRELLTMALLTDVDPGDHLRAIGRIRGFGVSPMASPAGASPLGAASLLRAAAFESQCREYLRSNFGLTWWMNRRAGDLLIDLWNTGYRHSPEELASLIGFGPLEYDWLVRELNRNVQHWDTA